MIEEFKFNKYVEQKITLSCGLVIQYFPYPTYHTTHMGFVIPYGANMSMYQVDGKKIKTGIAHFLEHRMFDSEKGDISELFARIGASCNAYTYFDRTCYYCSTSYDALEAFKILYEMVTNFYSTRERVINERAIIIQEMLEDLSSPISEMSKKMNYRLFSSGVFKEPIIGKKKDINSTTLDDLLLAYNAFYQLSNMTLIVVGPVDINKIIEYIENNQPKNIKNSLKIEKIAKEEDFTKEKYSTVYLHRDIVENIQGINFKVDVTELKKKYGNYQYERLMDYSLGLLFDIGTQFLEHFNKLDVSYNSFNYQYVDIDGLGLLSIKYQSKSSKLPNEVIIDALNNPEQYLNQRSIDLYEKRLFGKQLMLLQDTYSVFQEVTINNESDYNFLELYSTNHKINIDDIVYFIKYLSKGICLKGNLVPKSKKGKVVC